MREDVYHICPKYERAVELLGKRWTGLILRVLLDGPTTFSKIVRTVRTVANLSDRVLSERLKELERSGVVERRVHPTTPVKIEYSLTDKGRDLQQVLDEIQHWADRWETADHTEHDQAIPALRP